ncbi:hypothetical protein GGU11DRAFT_752934 [Lentinula aff. detonsa]|nr:hypothetical protein GGU11DRAFT_752934 [Lentinula aff. detonsa]
MAVKRKRYGLLGTRIRKEQSRNLKSGPGPGGETYGWAGPHHNNVIESIWLEEIRCHFLLFVCGACLQPKHRQYLLSSSKPMSRTVTYQFPAQIPPFSAQANVQAISTDIATLFTDWLGEVKRLSHSL